MSTSDARSDAIAITVEDQTARNVATSILGKTVNSTIDFSAGGIIGSLNDGNGSSLTSGGAINTETKNIIAHDPDIKIEMNNGNIRRSSCNR